MRRRELLRRAALLGLGGLAAGLGARSARAAGGRLNIVNPSGSLTLVLEEMLKEGNYFGQFGLDAPILNVSDGAKVIAALVSGSGDLCAGGGFSGVFPAIEKGAKIKIVAGASVRPDTAIFSRKPDIKEAKDLVGRTVGTGALGALLHELAVALLIKKGVDYTQVKFINIGSAVQVFEAVAAGTVDAGLGAVDVYYQQKKFGVHVLSDAILWNEIPEFANQAMFVSQTAIDTKRDLLVKALAAHAKLYRFLDTPGSKDAWLKARAAALGENNLTEAVQQWQFFNAPGQLATGLVLQQEQFEFVQKLNVQLGAQGKVLPFDQVADMSIARDAVKLLG